jgi:hypothetical protein
LETDLRLTGFNSAHKSGGRTSKRKGIRSIRVGENTRKPARTGKQSCRAEVWTIEAEGKDGGEAAFSFQKADYRLQNLNVLCLPTLRAFGYVELNRLAFLKSAEAVRLNCCVVHKYILTICTAQKAEPLGIVEPLHCTLFHCFFLSKEMTLNSIGVSAGSADS